MSVDGDSQAPAVDLSYDVGSLAVGLRKEVVVRATNVGVESTARQAHECGFNVALAVDAMMDRNPEAHIHSVTQIFPRLGETGTTEEILQLLDSAQA